MLKKYRISLGGVKAEVVWEPLPTNLVSAKKIM